MMHSDFIESIRPYVDFVTHCPEVEIGLGAPRQFVRIVMRDGDRRFVQPATDSDLTDTMNEYVEDLVNKLEGIDGFVLKEGSPSCSMSRVRYYSGPEKGAPIKTEGSGFFGGAVLERFHGTPIESDGRLRNARIRETFLTKIFMLADLRQTSNSGKMHELVKFHSRNKYSIMSFGQKYLKQLGRIVSNNEGHPFETVISNYRESLNELMGKTPRSTSIVNVMMKIYGYFSDKVSKRERDTFHESVKSFRKGTTSLTSLKEILRMWGIRFDETYVEEQSIFQPFPEALNSICDVASFKRAKR
jgi:uncharacterized protein YbgA (DUF1722 family)/uncharacterized protein YbbK (DUF523 family)